MPGDMGTTVGHVELDVSGVTEGAKKAKEAFDSIDQASEQSLSEMDKYAQTLSQTFTKAYDAITDALKKQEAATQKVIALQNELTEAQGKAAKYQSNAEKYSGIVSSQAAEKYAKTLQDIARIESELTAAQQEEQQAVKASEQARKQYADVSSQSVQKMIEAEQKAAQAAENTAKKQLELSTVNATKVAQTQAKAEVAAQAEIEKAKIDAAQRTAQKQMELSTQNVTKIAQTEITAAQNTQAKIEKAKIDAAQKATAQELAIRQKAQTDIEKAEIASRTKIEQTKIREAEKGARQAAEAERKEREKATRDAEREQEDAAKNIANNQAKAFAIAVNAVHEVINVVKKLAQEMLNLGKQIVEVGSDFEQSMAKVAATSGMSASDIKSNISDYADLVSAAKEAGATTVFTASQAGEALNYLALAGYNVKESIATMPDILTIAAAGAMDLGQASDMVTDAMNALDLEIDKTGEFIDKMAKTAQSSNTNVEQLGKSILTVGGTATVLAGGVTELDTAIGLMANSGIKAQQAGTSLRQIILNLTAPSDKAAKKMEELGLNVFDAEGNMRSLQDVFKDLNDILADFTDQERMDAMNDIFDARHIRAANALLMQCGDAWDELAGKIDNADGAAERMADTMMSTFKGALITAKSNLETIAITINDGLKKNLTDLVNEVIPRLKELNKTLASPEVQARLERFSAILKDLALNVLDKIINKIPEITTYLSTLDAHLEAFKIRASAIIALGLATQIGKVTAALKALHAFVITNPYAALALAVAEIIALIIELDAETSSYYKDMAAQVREEADIWEEQRQAVERVVEEWEDYKEAAQEVADKAESQAIEVKALYTEYKNLYEAGEDTTAAMEALAEEIPELNQMLAEGKTSFEDITQAVDDYCNSLLKSARLEAGKDLYVGAVKAQTEAERVFKDTTKAVEESYKAWQDAEAAVKEYEGHFDDPTFAYDYDEAERLRERADALHDIYQDNVKAKVDAFNVMHDAQKEAEEEEANYLEALKEESKQEGKIFDDRNSATKAANEKYAKDQSQFYKEQEAKSKQESQQMADSLAAGIGQIESKIKQRLATDDDKLKYYQQFFDVDHVDWDRTNTDLVDHYDKYMTLKEKKEKEVRDQQDKEMKEREKAAKEAQQKSEKAAQEADKAWVDAAKKGVSDIEWFNKQYYDGDKEILSRELKDFLERNKDFYDTHIDERQELQRKILELDKEVAEDRDKESKKAAETYVKNWTDGYDDLLDKAEKAYKQLESDYDKYRNNLLKGTEITAQETKKVWDAVSHSWKEEKVEGISSAKSLKDSTKQMEEVAKFIDQMESRLDEKVSESFLSQFMGMDSESQAKWMADWNKMSSGQQQEWLNAYTDNQKKATELSDKYFAEGLEDWKTNYWQPLQDYVNTGGDELQQAMQLAGEDSVQGFIDGIQEKYDDATGLIKDLYGGILTDTKDVLGIASPSKEFYAIGEFSIQGFLDGIQSKAAEVANIFINLGQTAGDSFVNAFKSTWDNFVTLLNNTGGLPVPVSMTTTAFGTPVTQGQQVYYTGTGTSYSGLTKADVVSAIKEAVPDGNVILKVDESEFGRVSRSSLNLLAQQQGTMDLRV